MKTHFIPNPIADNLELAQHSEKSEAHFLGFFEHATFGMCVVGLDMRFIQVNAAVCTMLGYSEEELLGTSWAALSHPDDLETSQQRKKWLILNSAGYQEAEKRFIHHTGEVVWVRLSVLLLRDDNANPVCFVFHMEDITQRKQINAAPCDDEERFRAIVDSCPSMMWETDAEGNIRFFNRACRRFGGIGEGKMSCDSWEALIHPDDAPDSLAAFKHAITKHAPFSFEARIKRADGEWRLLGSRAEPRLSPNGEYLGHIGLSADITDRRQIETDLQRAKDLADEANRHLKAEQTVIENERKMLHALIDNIPDFMYVKDRESRFVVANPHLAHVVGVKTTEELLGKTDYDFYPRNLADAFYEDDQNVIRSGQPLYNREEKGVDSQGNEVDILTTKVPVRDSKGQVIGIAGVGRDISVRKKMEDALREAEQKYRGIFDNAVIGIFQCAPDGRFLSVNSALAFTFGFDSPDEMLVEAADIYHQCYADPRRREEFEFLLRTVGGVRNFNGEAQCRDGSKIWMAMSIRAIRQKGVLVRFDGMCEDITERNQLREQLLQAQKLESVGQLAAGIAHEINTPTQYIGDNVRFMKDAFEDMKNLLAHYEEMLSSAKNNTLTPEIIRKVEEAVQHADAGYLLNEIPKAVDQTLEGVSRVSTIVSAMKEFSHPGAKEKVPTDLNHAIDSTITVARNEWKYVADLETDLDPMLPQILCLPGEFNQVILNLIVNAAPAIANVVHEGGPEKGTITLHTRSLSEWAEVRIQDTGSGIPEEIRGRVFDPFFTTKAIGKGTGQGLAIARSVVVNKHGGTIHFETEEGKGTAFIIRLPLDGKNLAPKGAAA